MLLSKPIRKFVALASALCLCVGGATPSFATLVPCDTGCEGCITIEYEHEGEPVQGARFELYQISTIDEDRKHELRSTYESLNIDLTKLTTNSAWAACTDLLDNYIAYEGIAPDAHYVTCAQGECEIDKLSLGMYLIIGNPTEVDDKVLYPEPTLLLVGTLDKNDDETLYDYVVEPKFYVVSEELEDLTVRKFWHGTNVSSHMPEKIVIELHCDGKKYDTVTLSAANGWMHTWKNIDPTKKWAVKELTELKDFTVTYEKEVFKLGIHNTYTGKPDKELPQTGSLMPLVSLFSGAGLILILCGVLCKQKSKVAKHDKKNNR